MSLLNWFLDKSPFSKKAPVANAQSQRTSNHGHGQAQHKSLPLGGTPTGESEIQMGDRKGRRYARREQLYVATRECMIKAGILSASYKFKVLSLDQSGDQFLVMMDIAPGLGSQAHKLTEIETLLISTANSLFSINVTSVYWRTDNRPVAVNATNVAASQPNEVESKVIALKVFRPDVRQPGAQRHDPIHNEEMAAFKLALVAASAHSPATSEGAGKSRSGLRSFTLITGFEDTEMVESHAAPALGTSQYGELR